MELQQYPPSQDYPYYHDHHHHYNLYSILGLPCYTSDVAAIGNAFLKQSQMYHPNRNNADPRSSQWYQTIEHAYEILKDPHSRADYDKFLVSSTQHDFNRSQAAKQQQSCLSWMTLWDRKQDSKSTKKSSSSDNKKHKNNDSTLMDTIQALESEVATLKDTNSKLWAQASCYLANTACLERETANLQNQLHSNEQTFHLRERGYVSRIRSLESAVASLRRSLEEYETKETKCNTSEIHQQQQPESVGKNEQVRTLIVNLNSQRVGGSSSKKNDHGKSDVNTMDKTPISSNLTLMAIKPPPPLPTNQQVQSNSRTISGKRPYHIMPSLMDKENLDDACKINVKRLKKHDHRSIFRQKPKRTTEFGVLSTNCNSIV